MIMLSFKLIFFKKIGFDEKKIILLQYSIRRRILNTLYIEHNHSNTQKKFGGNFPKKGKYLNFLKVEKELQITLLFKIFHAR